MAGRTSFIDDFEEAIETGPRHPDYTVLVTAPRGMGKTVFLNALEDRAAERGWEVISDDTSTGGVLSRLREAAIELLERLSGSGRAVTGLGVGPVSIRFAEPGFSRSPSLRRVLSEVGQRLHSKGSGLLITLDELHNADAEEVRELAVAIQHVTRREQLPIAFVGAGLDMIEDTILSGASITFFQRCSRFELGRLDPGDVREAISYPIRGAGSSIKPEALELASRETSGYPFMVQLVGFHSWKQAEDIATAITLEDVEAGLRIARNRTGKLVLEPVWKDLSNMDRRFLRAMALDDCASRLSDIAVRLDRSTAYARVYRNRLRKAGMVVVNARGEVDFAQEFARPWVHRRPDNRF